MISNILYNKKLDFEYCIYHTIIIGTDDNVYLHVSYNCQNNGA